jgi:single-strand DNA-binding protein
MNKVVLLGRLTKKPELKETKANKSVCDFSIAVNRNYTNDEGEREADFINCQVWNKQAENLCKYMDKGSQLSLEGNIRTDSYEDDKGNRRFKTYVLVSNIEYLETKKSESKKAVVEENKNPDQDFIDFGNEIELSDEDLGW